MTSSSKYLQPGQPKWNHNIQKYKDYDVFCEPGLISILFISWGKQKLTNVCLKRLVESTRSYQNEIEWLFIDNDYCDANYELFMSLPFERKVILRQSNFGINNSFNQLWRLSRGEYCITMESDWFNNIPDFNFLQESKNILDENKDIGIVQLRAIWSDNESWGRGKIDYSPWSCSAEQIEEAGMRLWNGKTKSGHEFLISQFRNGFNNNPNLIRKEIYRRCGPYPEPPVGTDNRHGETLYQQAVSATGCNIAHINKELFLHAGGSDRMKYESTYKGE